MFFESKWYNRDGDVIDVVAADRLLGDPDYKRVALTQVASASDSSANYLISTVWLGLDHSHTGGAPVIFEGMSGLPDTAPRRKPRPDTRRPSPW